MCMLHKKKTAIKGRRGTGGDVGGNQVVQGAVPSYEEKIKGVVSLQRPDTLHNFQGAIFHFFSQIKIWKIQIIRICLVNISLLISSDFWRDSEKIIKFPISRTGGKQSGAIYSDYGTRKLKDPTTQGVPTEVEGGYVGSNRVEAPCSCCSCCC